MRQGTSAAGDEHQRTGGISCSRGQLGHQPAKIIQDIRCRGQVGHQATEDRRDFEQQSRWDLKQQKTGGTSSSRRQAGHQAAEDRWEFKQQWTGGPTTEDWRELRQQRIGG